MMNQNSKKALPIAIQQGLNNLSHNLNQNNAIILPNQQVVLHQHQHQPQHLHSQNFRSDVRSKNVVILNNINNNNINQKIGQNILIQRPQFITSNTTNTTTTTSITTNSNLNQQKSKSNEENDQNLK
jgi:hypothetical protein